MKYIKRYSIVIFNLLKSLIFKIIYYRRYNFWGIQYLHPTTNIDFGNGNGKLILKGKVTTRKNVSLNIRNGNIEIGKETFFNSGCSLTSHDRIVIGDRCSIGPNVLFFDHDHLFDKSGVKDGYKTEKIVIGNNVWIGANSVILKGSCIGDNSIIAAGSIINGKIESNKIVIQKRETTIKDIYG